MVLIAEAQREFVRDRKKDSNKNQLMEFGTLSELQQHISPVAEESWRSVDGDIYFYYGYLFEMILPEDAVGAERYWCAVAWPPHDKKDWPAYCADHNGNVYRSQRPWETESKGPPNLRDVYTGVFFESSIDLSKWNKWP